MSDLTRRVLDADTRLTSEDGTISSAQWDDAVMELLDAAPILARQVEAVEAVVEAFAYAATLDRGLSEWEGMCDHFVKKCHAALEGDPQ